MTIGIYALRFTGTDKVYIGQSLNIEDRFKTHLNKLKNNKHSNKLQEAYNQYGKPNLEILCECSLEELNKIENKTIEIYNSFNNGFNSLEFAEDMPISDSKGEKNGMSKHLNEQIIEVFKLLVYSQEKSFREIKNITKVSYSTIMHIASGTRHCWLKDLYPEEYKILLNLKGTRSKKCVKEKDIVYPTIKSPIGEIYNIEHLSNFAREYNLDPSALCKVLYGNRITHKGWKLA